MSRSHLILSLLLLGGACAAQAAGTEGTRKTYKCLNEKGEVYFSDRFDPDHCKGGGAQLNAAGVAVKKIERPMTPEEIAAAKEQAARDAEVKRIADEKLHADQVLLQTFANEDEMTRAHQKELTQVETEVQAARTALQAQEKNLGELLTMAADSERAGTKVSDAVTKNIGIVRRQIESQKTFIARKQSQKDDLEATYQRQLKRYRDLASEQKAENEKRAAAKKQ